MKTPFVRLILVATLATFTQSMQTSVQAADGTAAPKAAVNTLTAEEQKQGWKLLFDGKTLDGWMAWNTKKPLELGAWTVQDGALTLVKPSGSDIYTTDPVENFEFSVEWKSTGNSGIFLRVDPSSSEPIYGVAPEIQILHTGGNKDNTAGALYALYEIEGDEILHPDGWNQTRVRMVNGHATHWLNGKKTYEYTIGSDDWNARLAKSKFKEFKGFKRFGLNANGHLGFQDHGDPVAFRNIKIRDLKAFPKKAR